MIFPLSTIILWCSVSVYAEAPVTSYAISGDSNKYDYSNSIGSTSYLGKDAHNENRDFYSGGHSGQSMINSGTQGNTRDALSSVSYSGFSPSSTNYGFGTYVSSNRNNLSAQYPPNSQTTMFRGYSSDTSTNTESNGYAGMNQGESDVNQYVSSSFKTPTYMSFSDGISGSSGSSLLEAVPEAYALKGYSTPSKGSFGYTDGDQGLMAESTYTYALNSDYPFGGKQKEAVFAGPKYVNDAYAAATDTRYIRHPESMYHGATSMYNLPSATSSLLSGLRASGSSNYGSGKLNKYGNKHHGDYNHQSGLNYLAREQDSDYLSSIYNKGSGKVVYIKDSSRPTTYGSQPYSGSYLSKVLASPSYKSKPTFVSYPGHGGSHSSLQSMHGSYNNNPYAEGHLPRGYRSSGGYVSGHTNLYPTYS